MSLFSTITHGEAPQLRGVSPRGLGAFALILIIGMVLGYALSTIEFGAESTQTQAASLDHAAFLKVNTTDLEGLVPMAPKAAATRTVAELDPFIWANVGSYAYLNEAWNVEPLFTRVNTELGVFGPYDAAEAARLGSFVEANTASYDGLLRTWEDQHSVDPVFAEINTDLPPTYVEPKSGPH